MTWSATVPPGIAALRTALAACPSWSAYVGGGNETARVHYPDATDADARPLAILDPVTDGRLQQFAAGVRGIPSGTAEITIIGDTGDGVDVLEKLAADLAGDLSALETGLPIRPVNYERAGESPLARQDDSASISITVEYGLA